MAIPVYKTFAGQIYPSSSLSFGDERILVIKTNLVEVENYIQDLKNAGYVSQSYRRIPSGIQNGENVYFACQNDKNNLTLFYDHSRHACSIIKDVLSPLPTYGQQEEKGKGELSLAQVSIRGGSSYVIKLKDGAFLVIDGGEYDLDDQIRLYNYLKENSCDEKITIKTWFFTHADSDHITLATSFLNEYAKSVEVERFCYQFPDFDKITMLIDSNKIKQNVKLLEGAIKTNYPNAKVYTARTGQAYYYDGASIEIIYSLDDTYPCIYPSPNEMSLAFKVNFDGGKSAVLLGDCMMTACRQMAFTYGEYLKADILQLAHHGLIGGDTYLYKTVNPDICFWDTTKSRFNGENEKLFKWCLGEGGCDYNAWIRDEKIKKRTHYINDKTNVIVF